MFMIVSNKREEKVWKNFKVVVGVELGDYLGRGGSVVGFGIYCKYLC